MIAIGAALLLTVVILGYVVLDRIPDWGLLGIAGATEAAALLVTVVVCWQLASGGSGLDAYEGTTLVGYLLTGLVILPLGFAWSLADRSRGATGVLAVAAFTLAFMILRAVQIWAAG